MYDVPNFVFKRGENNYQENPLTELLTDLDSLPLPARDLLYAENYFMGRNPIKAFMAGRGCPNSCSYCFNHRFNEMYRGKGRVMRVKSVSYLLREIGEVARATHEFTHQRLRQRVSRRAPVQAHHGQAAVYV